MLDYDYSEKPKKKKKHSKDDPQAVKAKPIRNFKIIDDDIDINKLNASEEAEALVDLYDPEGPQVVDESEYAKHKVIEKLNLVNNKNKWIKVDLCQDEEGEFSVSVQKDDDTVSNSKGLFKKRGEKSTSKQADDEGDSDLDLPRRRPAENNDDNDSDLDLPRRRSAGNADGDLSPVRRKPREEPEVDETKVRVRKPTRDEELKKAKKAEKEAKYMEWGKGLVQKKEREEKLQSDLYEADKPLARYKNDQDLERLLKEQEREEDPMLEYLRKNRGKDGEVIESAVKKPIYKGPPAPPNRYGILPGARWDGVDRSNGFEKKYYESIVAKKSRDEEAYKWSIEDM